MITYQDAKEYTEKGFSVFPVILSWNGKDKKFEKKPAVEWRDFQNRLPTETELHKWFDKPIYNGLGLATGEFSGVVVVDIESDCPEEDRKDIKSSMGVRTISGGWHYYFRWNKEIRNTVKIRNKRIDFRGDGGFVVVPPSECNSKSYSWEGHLVSPMFLTPLPEWLEKELINDKLVERGERFDITQAIGVPRGSRNNVLKSVILSLFNKYSPDEAWNQTLVINDTFKPPEDIKTLKETYNAVYKYFLVNKEKISKPSNKPEKTFITANFEGLCDLVNDNGKVKFLTLDKELLESKEVNGQKYLPPTLQDLDFFLPEAQDVLKESARHKVTDVTDDTDDGKGCPYCLKLYNELRLYHEEISELPHPLYYDLLVLWDFHTYLIERFVFSPIIYFFADRERGKTRTAKGLIFVSRRGIMTETLREANLIRWGRDHKATLLFDLKNFPRKLRASQSEDLVFGRVERGVTASRVLFPEKGAFRDTVKFEVFGPTIITSNRMIDDIGISRTITLDMKPSDRIFTSEPIPESALELKTKLTGMRLAHLQQEFDQSPKEETGRMEDMLIGYLRMIKTLYPTKERVYRSLKEVVRGQKKETAMDSFEAQILQIIISQEDQVEPGSVVLLYDLIASIYNDGKRENLHLDGRALSRITRGMGFVAKRNSDGTKRGIFYDTKLISKLKLIYGLEDEESPNPNPPASSVSSEMSDDEPKEKRKEVKLPETDYLTEYGKE